MLKKPTIEERQAFLLKLKNNKSITKASAHIMLGESCGVSPNTVSKWFLPVISKSHRDCPPAVWRCWGIDFEEEMK